MRFKDVVKHFGTVQKAADALMVERQTIYAWKYRRRIPYATQAEIQLLTKGALSADVRQS